MGGAKANAGGSYRLLGGDRDNIGEEQWQMHLKKNETYCPDEGKK